MRTAKQGISNAEWNPASLSLSFFFFFKHFDVLLDNLKISLSWVELRPLQSLNSEDLRTRPYLEVELLL